jgi:predicted amidophosphoribosyltransferase
MTCPTCGTDAALTDNFCPRCGTSVRNSRLPVKREQPEHPALFRQALIRQAAPAVARAGAFVAAGVLAQWFLRSAGKQALNRSVEPRKKPATQAVVPAQPKAEPIIAVSETVVWRRIIIRR